MVLLDTNVLSELRKAGSGRAHPNVARWADSVDPTSMYLSVITIQEIEMGIAQLQRRDPAQAAALTRWLEGTVLPAFAGRIFSVDIEVARRSGRLHLPTPRPFHDALIAATALVHGVELATRNVKDFQNLGIRLLNPWNSAPDGP
jgi:predicted nucleic acid-binding protein